MDSSEKEDIRDMVKLSENARELMGKGLNKRQEEVIKEMRNEGWKSSNVKDNRIAEEILRVLAGNGQLSHGELEEMTEYSNDEITKGIRVLRHNDIVAITVDRQYKIVDDWGES